MLALSRMPRLYAPVIDVPGYERTSVDRFWLVVPCSDPAWTEDLSRELEGLGAKAVRTVVEEP
jgi:hypothetical protein